MEVGPLLLDGLLNPKISQVTQVCIPKKSKTTKSCRLYTLGSGILDPWIIPEGLVRKTVIQNAQMLITISSREYTLPETNIAPETLGLEDEFPFGKAFLTGAMLGVVSGRLYFSYRMNLNDWLWMVHVGVNMLTTVYA